MKSNIKLPILLIAATVYTLCNTANAATTPPKINFPAQLTSGWWVEKGNVVASGNELTIKGGLAKTHVTLNKFVKTGEAYTLNANVAVSKTKGNAFYRLNFYGKTGETLGSLQGNLNAPALSQQFKVPLNSTHARLQLESDRAFDGTLKLSQIELASDNSKRLRYAPPTLINPVTLVLGTGYTSNTLDVNKDYIVKLPNTKKLGSTFLIGGRNIVIMGGHITVPLSKDLSNSSGNRAIYIKNNEGTVHVEGVLIDSSGGAQADAIAIASPKSIVQIQNVRVDSIYGYNDQLHADIIQPFGGVKELRVDRLTGYTGYQGLQIDAELGQIGSAKLENINLISTDKQTWGSHNNGGVLMWLVKDLNTCKTAYPITLKNVYLKPREDRLNVTTVYPSTTDKACPSVNTNGIITFPKLPIEGSLTLGTAPMGDFVRQVPLG